jgi:hypothetical protein
VIERIAKHLFNEDEAHLPEPCRLGWDRAKPLTQITYLKRARGFLTVIREPTDAMVAATAHTRSRAAAALWRDMVDEAAKGDSV